MNSSVSDLLQRALRAQAEGRIAEAEHCCRSALSVDPNSADALHLLGTLLQAAGRGHEAIDALRRACLLKPNEPEVHFHLANALSVAGRLPEAIDAYRESIRVRPGFFPALTSLGNLYRSLGQLENAIHCYREASRSDGTKTQPWHNLANAYYESCRHHDAIEAFDRAIATAVESSESRFSRGLAQLAIGNLDAGWEGYEFRKSISRHKAYGRPYAQPDWRGEDLTNRSILVWGEQGVGDEILFASMYAEVIARAGCCYLECDEKLAPLFARSFPRAQVAARRDTPMDLRSARADYQLGAGSLARLLRPSLAAFPDHCGYLSADAERVARWKKRLTALGPGLKVGICWRSANRSPAREPANTHLNQWGDILGVGGVQFVSLQYDECEAELASAEAQFGTRVQRFAEVDCFNDLDEVAAQMCALDLVISARTAVSWEAAALGVPTWQFTAGGDWRGHGTNGVPWMPRLIRFQRAINSPWNEVLRTIAVRLGELSMGFNRA